MEKAAEAAFVRVHRRFQRRISTPGAEDNASGSGSPYASLVAYLIASRLACPYAYLDASPFASQVASPAASLLARVVASLLVCPLASPLASIPASLNALPLASLLASPFACRDASWPACRRADTMAGDDTMLICAVMSCWKKHPSGEGKTVIFRGKHMQTGRNTTFSPC